MTVRELLHNIKILKLSWDITDDTPIVYSQDDEGNNYQGCVFWPGFIYSDRELTYGQYLDPEDIIEEKTPKSFTYLCIN